jgi:hypothetical protein
LTFFGMLFLPVVVVDAQVKTTEAKADGQAGRPQAICLEMGGPRRLVEFLTFSPDSNILVYSVPPFLATEPPVMVFYDLKERRKVKTLRTPGIIKRPVTPVFLPGGKQLIAGGYGDRMPSLLDWRTGKYTPFDCEDSETCAWYPDGLTVERRLLHRPQLAQVGSCSPGITRDQHLGGGHQQEGAPLLCRRKMGPTRFLLQRGWPIPRGWAREDPKARAPWAKLDNRPLFGLGMGVGQRQADRYGWQTQGTLLPQAGRSAPQLAQGVGRLGAAVPGAHLSRRQAHGRARLAPGDCA